VKIEIAEELCEGCGICVSVCPKNIFFLENGKAKVRNVEDCIRCMACEINCPFHAVKLVKEI